MQNGVHNPGNRRYHELSLIWKLNVDSCFSAKLGDTKELEDFIADLDRTLASEYVPGIKKKKNQTENQPTQLIKCHNIYQLAWGQEVISLGFFRFRNGP